MMSCNLVTDTVVEEEDDMALLWLIVYLNRIGYIC